MLHLVRKHADSWLIKSILWMIVFAFIGTIFYSWGMGGASERRGGAIATVDGNEINYVEYEKAFNNLIEFYRDQFRSQFTQDLIEKLDLKTVALDGLIHRKLLLLEAQKQHIRVSDTELINSIKSFPTFQRDNRFNRRLYDNYLKFKRLTPKEFESGQREALALGKIERFIKGQVKVSESEILETFKREEDKIKFDYITFAEDHFTTSEKPTEEEKKAYYEKNKSLFQVPEQIKIQYVRLETQTLRDQITPREEDIQDYYKSEVARFYEEEQFRASHILFRIQKPDFDEDASEDEKEKKLTEAQLAAKKKAEEILKKIREGTDFAEMAKIHSDDKVSGANGGDLGDFVSGAMVSQFEKAMLNLKVGEISEPAFTPFGYHLIRLDERKEPHTKPLEEVKEVIIQALKEIKARQRARRIVKRIHRSAKTDQDLARAALEEKTEVKTTEFISQEKHNIPEIGIVPEFYNVVFTLPDNRVSFPVHTAEASHLMKVIERKPPYIQDLADVQDQLKKAVLEEKNKTLTSENVKVLAQQVAENKSLEKVADSLKLEIKNTAIFSEADSIPGIGAIQAIKDKVFLLKKGETTMVFARDKYYIIKLVDRQPAGQPDETQRKAFYERLKREKANIAFNDWLESLRVKANVMIDRSLL